ncbi:MAG TPA: DUF4432 family protein [Candidatus Koribacter sp.]|jgi:hypothetical protein
MPPCHVSLVSWKGRRACRISNSTIELTFLLGGGHIADLRLCGSEVNALFESPWPTIEPQSFSPEAHNSIYGSGPVGRLLCGYTGHALALGYFGLPSDDDAERGLPLHGEAVAADWNIAQIEVNDEVARVSAEVLLPHTGLRFSREFKLHAGAFTVAIEETVFNSRSERRDFQWVEHTAFGRPLLDDRATLYLSATRGVTWPLGYEGHELLANNCEFRWPHAPAADGSTIDLSHPFARSGTGFVAALLLDAHRSDAFIAVHNRRLNLIAGYVFDRRHFPWVALWEENCARNYSPWNGITRVRGVEFGTSPMPLGLDHARQMQTLLDAPVFTAIEANGGLTTRYQIFIAPAASEFATVSNVSAERNKLIIHGSSSPIVLSATE